MINDLVRLGDVKRWHIVATTREQSVAEHSALVAYIAREICIRTGQPQYIYDCMIWALMHDSSESILGDPPSPVSQNKALAANYESLAKLLAPWKYEYEAEMSDEILKIVKIADRIEALVFHTKYGCEQNGSVNEYLLKGYSKVSIDEKYTEAANNVLFELIGQKFTVA